MASPGEDAPPPSAPTLPSSALLSRELDTRLLSGVLSPDDYASALLRRTQETDLSRAERELAAVRAERDALRRALAEQKTQVRGQARTPVLTSNSTTASSSPNTQVSNTTTRVDEPDWYAATFAEELGSAGGDEPAGIESSSSSAALAPQASNEEEEEARVRIKAELDELRALRARMMEERQQRELASVSATKHDAMIEAREETIRQLTAQVRSAKDRFERMMLNEAEAGVARRHFRAWRELAGRGASERLALRLARTSLARSRASRALRAWSEETRESKRIERVKTITARATCRSVLRAWAQCVRERERESRLVALAARAPRARRAREALQAWREMARERRAGAVAEEATSTQEKAEEDSALFATIPDVAAIRDAAAKQRIEALIYAARRGDAAATLALINEGSAVNMSSRGNGESPLHAAAEAGSEAVAQLLLENGANPTATNDEGETPLHACAKKGDEAYAVALCLLRRGARTNEFTKYGWTALMLAVQSSSPKIVTVLLNYRAAVELSSTEAQGWTAVHEAAKSGSLDALRALLGDAPERAHPLGPSFPADVNGRTPLHVACARQPLSAPALDYLLRKGFDARARNASGQTPLHLLCANPTAWPHLALLDAGFLRLGGAELEAQDAKGNTALHFACRVASSAGHGLEITSGFRRLACELVTLGAPVYLVNAERLCPLDQCSPAFAVDVLRCVRDPPAGLDRCHRGLTKCMMCRDALQPPALLSKRLGDNCRRCGRLMCPKCLSYEAKWAWPELGGPTAAGGVSDAAMAVMQKVLATAYPLGERSRKVCQNCHTALSLPEDTPFSWQVTSELSEHRES